MFIQNNFLVNRLCLILVCYTEKNPTKTQQKLVICRFSAKKRKKKKENISEKKCQNYFNHML